MARNQYSSPGIIQGYQPALDGLRAVCILLVVVGHAGYSRFVPAGLGVTMFFVLSGFLLSGLMIREIEGTGSLNFARFYLRRLIRIMPAMLFYIVLFSIIMLDMGTDISLVHILTAVLPLANYYHYLVGYPENSPFPVLWSLAVEEHFYIVFPFLLYAFRKNLRSAIPVFFLLVAAALVWRTCLYYGCYSSAGKICDELKMAGSIQSAVHFRTDTIFDCLLYGAIAALLVHCHANFVRRRLISLPAFILAVEVLLVTLLYRDSMFRETLRFSLQFIVCAVLILNLLYGTGAMNTLRTLLSARAMVFLGRISYSLYLFHYGALILVHRLLHQEQPIDSVTGMVFYLAVSLLFAVVSYLYVERPMLALRRRFGSYAIGTLQKYAAIVPANI